MSYKSPIDVFLGAIQTNIENETFKAIQKYGIHVDKEELIKALKYDRGQYEEGYTDGYWAGKNSVVRCMDCEWWETRSCGSPIGKCQNPRNGLVSEYTDNTDFCSYGERKEQE